MQIRPATSTDYEAILAIIAPVLAAGETYTLPTNMTGDQIMEYWFSPGHSVFVAVEDAQVLGTYYLKANQQGGGSHVANCGYMTAAAAQGRGIARQMCEHSLKLAAERGFLAMQFNHVVSTNTRAVALWKSLGFSIAGTLPGAFHHPTHGYVDSYVMFKTL